MKKEQGWNETQIQLAATQVISRAAYPASELKTSQWIKENSAVCDCFRCRYCHTRKLSIAASKGYFYVCVSRTRLKDYTTVRDRLSVILETKSKSEILIKAVQTDVSTDYYLEITSPAKALKEEGMKNLFETRFEEALERIKNSVHKKNGVKKVSKVHERTQN